MPNLFQAGIVGSLVALIVVAAVVAQSPGEQLPSDHATGVAVVELFTSQGCSSCPPADRVLTRLDEVAHEQGLPIYVLSMHVDYWNRLGWTDPYSSRVFTERQNDYATAARSTRVYTPQMIVNGETEFVGSDARQAERAVSAALNQPATATIQLQAAPSPGAGALRVAYNVRGVQPGSDLVLCAVADPSPNDVASGENVGRRLVHRSVVRAIRVEPLRGDRSGEVTLQLPAELNGAVIDEVVAFVQDRATRRIDGAAKIAIIRR